MQNIGLEQLDALLDPHLKHFFRGQVRQFDPRFVDGRQLLLLHPLFGDVANRNDQVLGRSLRLENRCRVHLQEGVLADLQCGAAGVLGRQGRVEGTEVRSQDFRVGQRGEEILAHHVLAATPLAETRVAPDHDILGIEQHDAVGHAFQNPFILEQPTDLQRLVQMRRNDVQPGVVAFRQAREGLDRIAFYRDVKELLKTCGHARLARVTIANTKDFGLFCQPKKLHLSTPLRS